MIATSMAKLMHLCPGGHHPSEGQHRAKHGNVLDDQPLPGGHCRYSDVTGSRCAVSEAPDYFGLKRLLRGIVDVAHLHRAGGRVNDVDVRGVNDVYVLGGRRWAWP